MMLNNVISTELTEDLKGIIEGELNSPQQSTKQFILNILSCDYESHLELFENLKNAMVYKNEIRLAFVIAHYFYNLTKEMYFIKELVQMFTLDTSIAKDETCMTHLKDVIAVISCSCTGDCDDIAKLLFECLEASILNKDVELLAKYSYETFAKSDWAKKQYIQRSLDRLSCYLVKSGFKRKTKGLTKILSAVDIEIPNEEISNIYCCIGILYLMKLRTLKNSYKGKKTRDKKKRKLKCQKHKQKMLEAFLKAFKSGSQIAGKQIMSLYAHGKVKLSKSQINDIEKIINWQQRYIN